MFSRNGKQVLTGSYDGTTRIWDTTSGRARVRLTGHTESLYGVSFSPGGKRVVTAGAAKTARVWDVSTGKQVHALVGHTDIVYDARFSPDGSRLVTASRDTTARLWVASTGRGTLEYPDGKWIATASHDKMAHVFPCEVCGSLDDVLKLAKRRVSRQLTQQEREKYLIGRASQ